MRVLVLHSDVPADAPPDEQDTLAQAAAIARALTRKGHEVAQAAFVPDPDALAALVRGANTDVVFNLVETVWGSGGCAMLAPAMLDAIGVPYTGSGVAAFAASGDKPFSKRLMRAQDLPTPDWAEPPSWQGLRDGVRYIVKSVAEDASLGLDDGAVVAGRDAVLARALESAARHGGRWFAEAYVDGREFNVAIIEENGSPRVLPIAEMCFEDWDDVRPRIVGYAAKWDEASFEARKTVRAFGAEKAEPALSARLAGLAQAVWRLFGLSGYGRVDFRVDSQVPRSPYILEINPNPCLAPDAGLAAASEQAGISYADLIDRILRGASRG